MAASEEYVELTIKFAKEDDQWVARCQELGTSTCADTFEEANEAINALILLHLNALEDAGARKAFFRKHGIHYHRTKPPQQSRTVPLRFDEFVTRVTEPLPKALSM